MKTKKTRNKKAGMRIRKLEDFNEELVVRVKT